MIGSDTMQTIFVCLNQATAKDTSQIAPDKGKVTK